jgi:hypothetical protein
MGCFNLAAQIRATATFLQLKSLRHWPYRSTLRCLESLLGELQPIGRPLFVQNRWYFSIDSPPGANARGLRSSSAVYNVRPRIRWQ